MNISFVTQALPYLPSRDGFRIYGANLIRCLSSSHHIDLVSILEDGDEAHLDWPRQYCTSVTVLPKEPGQYLDVLEAWAEPQYAWSLADTYNQAHKPVIVWTSLMSTDSPATAIWGTLSSTCDIAGGNTGCAYTTQGLRGQCYQQLIDEYINTVGSDGSSPVAGLNWWERTAKAEGGENSNFGLVTDLDDAYNDTKDVIQRGTDSWGFGTGGEKDNYGDLLSCVVAAHTNLPRLLWEPTARPLSDSGKRGPGR